MADSKTVVKALHEVDPGFRQLCDTIFGGSVDVDEVWAALYTPTGVSKLMPDPGDVHVLGSAVRRGRLVHTRRTAPPDAVRVKKGRLVPAPRAEEISKDDEDSVSVTWAGEFAKADTAKREVFGWASVVQLDGKPVVDLQGDEISPEELERAAYSYVRKSRVGGQQHRRNEDEDTPFHASDMIESMVMTPEKISKMGLPEGTPVGWWVGYKVHDDETWTKIEKGELTGFSIHGKGRRVPVDA